MSKLREAAAAYEPPAASAIALLEQEEDNPAREALLRARERRLLEEFSPIINQVLGVEIQWQLVRYDKSQGDDGAWRCEWVEVADADDPDLVLQVCQEPRVSPRGLAQVFWCGIVDEHWGMMVEVLSMADLKQLLEAHDCWLERGCP